MGKVPDLHESILRHKLGMAVTEGETRAVLAVIVTRYIRPVVNIIWIDEIGGVVTIRENENR